MHEISLCFSLCAILVISRKDVGIIPWKGPLIMLKSLLLTLTFTIIPLTADVFAQGRAPAVEPEMGISIEEYQEVHAGPEKGFDFTQATPGVSAAIVKQAKALTGQGQLAAKNVARNPNAYAGKEKAPAPIWTLLALTALPFGLWLLLRQTFPKDISTVASQGAHPEGPEAITIDLASEREKRKSLEEDDEDKHTKVG